MRGIFGCALAALVLAVVHGGHHGHNGHHGHHGHQGHQGHHDHHGNQQHQDHHHHNTESEMTCHRLSPANADFAIALYKKFNDKAGGRNVFFSPVGISSALSMLSVGAQGDTHKQLFSTLGYGALDQAQVDDSYQHLFHMLGHSQEEQQLDVGNIAAVRIGFTPQENFLNVIRDSYSAEISAVDFNSPTSAVAEINRMIANKTHDKIKDMVKDLDSAMAMVLINYVYFRGQWEKPFDSTLTKVADFHVDSNVVKQVQMMERTGRFDFYHDYENHTAVILLPYKGNTTMMVVLPGKDRMKEVEDIISKDILLHWHDSVYRTSMNLSMPKFSISADADLDSTLKELNLIKAYTDEAEFSGISAEVPLKLSKTSHRAVLSVDERGTEAAAGTVMEIMPMIMPEVIRLDRPFLIFILEHSTKSILFMGKINDPTAI